MAKKKNIVHLPSLDGGNKAFREFIANNLVYPEQALNKKIEGIVFIEYEINDDGFVTRANVKKGIGFGCDEEAVRVIKLMRFSKVRNKGYRVSSKRNARILFKLPETDNSALTINYNFVPQAGQESVSYTIKINTEDGAKPSSD